MTLMVEEYVSNLDVSFRFTEDYWSDMGISRETETLSKFSGSDWAALEDLVKRKSAEWLVRCAETLRERDHHEATAFSILLWMISAGRDIEVKIAALDAISCRISRGFDVGEHAESIRLGASSVSATAGGDVVPGIMANLSRKCRSECL